MVRRSSRVSRKSRSKVNRKINRSEKFLEELIER